MGTGPGTTLSFPLRETDTPLQKEMCSCIEWSCFPLWHSRCCSDFQRKFPHAGGQRGSWGSRLDWEKQPHEEFRVKDRQSALKQKGSSGPAFARPCRWLEAPWMSMDINYKQSGPSDCLWLKVQQLRNPQAISWVFIRGHSTSVQAGHMELIEKPLRVWMEGWEHS